MKSVFKLSFEELNALDEELEAEGVPLHNRPFHAAMRLSKDRNISVSFSDPVFDQISVLYKQLYPQGDFGVGGLLVGVVVLRNRAYLADVNIVFGRFAIDPLKQMQVSAEELEIVWRLRPNEIWRAVYSVWDLWDFRYGSMDLNKKGEVYPIYWSKAAGHIEATARTLASSRLIDICVQSSCLAAELSLKAGLLRAGESEAKLRKIGHNLPDLVELLIEEAPLLEEDEGLRKSIKSFPPLVDQRYGKLNLSDKEILELALRAQFVAASTTRRFSDRNAASAVKDQGPVRDFF